MGKAYEQFGRYTVYESLGTGGMATVHRAVFDDGKFVREVALKRLLPQFVDDAGCVDDFVREGRLASRLSHSSIVSIIEVGRIDGTHFIAMELVLGVSVMQLIRATHAAKRTTPIGVVLALMSELSDALDHACNGSDRDTGERFNFIHRDLSPSNLLVTDDGHLKVIDFGVAKATAGWRFTTETGLVKGKLGYMSVEALAGKGVDARSDVFAVGVVAWELITGRRLFTGKNETEVIERVRDGAVAPPSTFNSSCTPTLDSIVLQALERDRDERWPGAAALRNALETTRRAYREESNASDVMRWREQLLPPTPRPPEAERVPRRRRAESQADNEKTRFRPSPSRPTPMPVRHATMLELLDDEPAEVASGTDRVLQTDDTAAPLQLFDTFPAAEEGRTVLAAAAYPASVLRDAATVYTDQHPYAEIAVQPATGVQVNVHTAPTVLAPIPTVHTAATVTAPMAGLVDAASGTSITAVSDPPSASPTVTNEMLQLDDPIAHDVLDLQDPLAELLDLDDPPAKKAPELLDLHVAQTVVTKTKAKTRTKRKR